MRQQPAAFTHDSYRVEEEKRRKTFHLKVTTGAVQQRGGRGRGYCRDLHRKGKWLVVKKEETRLARREGCSVSSKKAHRNRVVDHASVSIRRNGHNIGERLQKTQGR